MSNDSNNPYPPSRITGSDTESIIIYSPRTSADNPIRLLSPTSSTDGIYVHSRQTPMKVPVKEGLELDFGGFYQAASVNAIQRDSTDRAYSLSPSAVPDGNNPISTPVTSSEANNLSTHHEYVKKCMSRRAEETRARLREFNERHARMMNYCRESMTNYIEPTANKKLRGRVRGSTQKGDQKSASQNIGGKGDGSNAPEMVKR